MRRSSRRPSSFSSASSTAQRPAPAPSAGGGQPPLLSDGLSPRQKLALQRIWEGGSLAEVAAAAQVSRTTLHRWRKEHPVFRVHYLEMRAQVKESVQQRLILLTDTAVDTLGEAIMEGDAKVAFAFLRQMKVFDELRPAQPAAAQGAARVAPGAVVRDAAGRDPQVTNLTVAVSNQLAVNVPAAAHPASALHATPVERATLEQGALGNHAVAGSVAGGLGASHPPIHSAAPQPLMAPIDNPALDVPDAYGNATYAQLNPREPLRIEPTEDEKQLHRLKTMDVRDRPPRWKRYVRRLERQVAKRSPRNRKRLLAERDRRTTVDWTDDRAAANAPLPPESTPTREARLPRDEDPYEPPRSQRPMPDIDYEFEDFPPLPPDSPDVTPLSSGPAASSPPLTESTGGSAEPRVVVNRPLTANQALMEQLMQVPEDGRHVGWCTQVQALRDQIVLDQLHADRHAGLAW